MGECPFTPPFPQPLTRKPGLVRRFWLGWQSWIHTLHERTYSMKMGGTRLPGMGVFIVNEGPLLARVLDDAAGEFPKHGIFDDLLAPLVGQSVFNANGAAWARLRAMVNPAFVHTHLRRAFPAMAEAAGDAVARMRAAAGDGGIVDMDPMMTHVAADVIFRTMFSRAMAPQDAERVYHAFEAYQRLAQRNTLLTLYGLPHFGLRGRARKLGARIREDFARIVAERVAARAAGERFEDILETLLDTRDPETGEGLTREELVNQVTLIFFGGHETTATSLGWTLYLLSESPDWQERLWQEIEAATGGDALRFEHVRALEGLRHVYREALRLYPPVSFLPRGVAAAMEMRGKAMVPGDLVLVAPWLVHRNPQTWDCPHQFDPDRFGTPEGAEAAKAGWMPFGRGPRVCIGAGFATQEAMVVLAQVIRAFRISHPEGARPEVTARLTLRPKRGFPLILTPR